MATLSPAPTYPVSRRPRALPCVRLLLVLIAGMTAASSVRSAYAGTIRVAADGSGDVRTIRDAIAAIPDGSAERTVVLIKAGTYDEQQIVLPRLKTNVTWMGEDRDSTIITYGRNVREQPADGSAEAVKGTGVVIRAEGFRAENLTFRNTSGDHGQAMALRVEGDRAAIINCRLLGWQDTLLVHSGRQYYRNCYIEGRVDFIYGGGTAVFEACHIHSKNGGFITAASTPPEREFGFVFLRCRLTGDDNPWIPPIGSPAATKPARADKRTYLGRPWRPYAQVAFIECEMGDHIRPEGWHNWDKPDNERKARFSEYKSSGPGGAAGDRVAWSRQLDDAEARKFTVANVLSGTDGWTPDVQD